MYSYRDRFAISIAAMKMNARPVLPPFTSGARAIANGGLCLTLHFNAGSPGLSFLHDCMPD